MANISKLQLSGATYNIVDTTSGYATKTELTNAVTGATEIINGELDNKFGYASYNEANKHIEFKASETGSVLAYVDATDFIKDGMIESAEIADGTGDNVGKKVLKLTFNTDAGKDAIEVPIGDLFNADNYYTKNEADGKFGTKTEQESLRSDLEDALGEIASLEADKQDKLSQYVYSLESKEDENQIYYNTFGTNSGIYGAFIQLKTINGGGIIGNGNITLPTSDDVNNAITAATTPINATLETKADKSNTYTKAETDKAINDAIEEAGAITPEGVDAKIDTAINGLKTVGGEVLKGTGNIALMTAKVENDTLIFEFN